MRFTGILRKPVDLDEAPARDFRACFAIPADESDRKAYAVSQFEARWEAFDHCFELDSGSRDIWQFRVMALLAHIHKVDRTDPRFWAKLALRIANGRVPGLSLKKSDKKRHGAPREWSDQRLA